MNWGNKLFIVFLIFGSMIAYMVYRCLSSSVDLVSQDYYKDELVYQQVINGKLRAEALGSNVIVRRQQDLLQLTLPTEMKDQQVSGSIFFYCASASGNDRKILLHTDAKGCQQIPVKSLKSGAYIVKVQWQADDNEYYSEQPVTIP